jgi:nicotinate-nucleotide adenylyltransferase
MKEGKLSSGKEVTHKLGIMGGTFDPIHNGHLKVAEVIRSRFALDKVIFVPSLCPPHKGLSEIASVEHRYAMVNLAIADNPFFESSRIEIDRPCPTYAGDTIEAFRKKYGKSRELYFITGLDALLSIISRDRSRTYPGICQFIAAARPGYNRKTIEKSIPPDLKPFITIIEEPALAISSTEIRARIKNHQTIDHLVPEAVREYIANRSLYL